MTKILKSKYKISRRLGVSIWGRDKDPVNVKKYKPGQHGPSGMVSKLSDYGMQLRAKQRLKGHYGYMTERQFSNLFKKAVKLKGDTGENLISLLEKRLDSVVYRLNLAPTIFAARQLVSHKHVVVNGRVVNIPSYTLCVGDKIELMEGSRGMPVVVTSLQKMERSIPSYLECDVHKAQGSLLAEPHLTDVPYPMQIELNMVIEFYSR